MARIQWWLRYRSAGPESIVRQCSTCCWWKPNRVPQEIGVETERMCWFHNEIRDDEDSCEHHVAATDTAVTIPQHTPKEIMGKFFNANPVDGVEILIVSYWKDFPWLKYAVQCIQKHATGFSGATILVPFRDMESFVALQLQPGPTRVIVKTFDEYPGKGFLHHEAMMAKADECVPAGTNYVCHMDSDTMMKMANEPRHYFLNDKPIYIWRTWESLSSPDPRDPTQKVVSDCIMWKEPTAKQVGFHSDAYTMCRHPTVFPISFYPAYREHIQNHHQMPFLEYMLAGERNSHPQDRLDFTAFGQYAFHFMHDQFHWINCATEEYPADRMKTYWSHSGVTEETRREIESFLIEGFLA